MTNEHRKVTSHTVDCRQDWQLPECLPAEFCNGLEGATCLRWTGALVLPFPVWNIVRSHHNKRRVQSADPRKQQQQHQKVSESGNTTCKENAAAVSCVALGLPELATVVNYCYSTYVTEPAIPVIHRNCGDPPKLLSFQEALEVVAFLPIPCRWV